MLEQKEIVKGKVLARISFSSFPLFKFMEALSSLRDDVTFSIKKDLIQIDTMNASRIVLMQLKVKNDSYEFLEEGNIMLNIDDLKNVLKCQVGDKSDTKLTFTDKELQILIKSKAYGSEIERSLEQLTGIDREEIPFDNLNAINYLCSFSLTKPRLEYTMRNLKVYSEIVFITGDEQMVTFGEEGQMGKGIIKWKRDKLSSYNFNEALAQEELEKIKKIEFGHRSFSEDKQIRLLEKVIKDKKSRGAYSITFLSVIRKMASVIDKCETVQFFLKDDYPAKSQITFNKLGDVSIVYYMAPRVEEAEFDEDKNRDEDEDDEF